MKPQPITTAYDLTTGRGRLRYLADEVLTRVTREALPFDLSSWVAYDKFPHDCGTAGCAVGWAARDALLSAEGLTLQPDAVSNGKFVCPTFEAWDNWSAVEAFFGISWDESERFFVSDQYDANPTAADVAARIRAHLAETEGV